MIEYANLRTFWRSSDAPLVTYALNTNLLHWRIFIMRFCHPVSHRVDPWDLILWQEWTQLANIVRILTHPLIWEWLWFLVKVMRLKETMQSQHDHSSDRLLSFFIFRRGLLIVRGQPVHGLKPTRNHRSQRIVFTFWLLKLRLNYKDWRDRPRWNQKSMLIIA